MRKIYKGLLLLGSGILMGFPHSHAQIVVDGTNFQNFGYVSNYDAYTAVTAAAGSSYNAGSGAIFDHNETDPNSMRIDNTYNANGPGGSADNFNGPNGVAGVQGISGSVAPDFATLVLKNGVASAFNITNTAGANVFASATFQNGITTTVRANTANGALRFQNGATYTGGLTDTQHVNGYVGKAGDGAFVFPVGSGTDSRTLTMTAPTSGSALLSTAYQTSNVENAAAVQGPIVGVYTAGSWDWAAANAGDDDGLGITVSIPSVAGFAQASDLRLVGWNGSQWIDLSGSATASGITENSTLAGTIPAGVAITQIGIGTITLITDPIPCIAEKSFSNYRNLTPAPGTASQTFVNNDGSNTVTFSNDYTTGAPVAGRPFFTVLEDRLVHTKGGGISSTRMEFATPTSEYIFNVSDYLSTEPGVYAEHGRITGYDAANNPVYPIFYNLINGAQIIGANNNEIIDGAAGGTNAQAGAFYYFATPVKYVINEQLGFQDFVINRIIGCPLRFDFGDAPESYGTTLAANGPRHATTNNAGAIMLGNSIENQEIDDQNNDGQPSTAANGDGSDEDGVAVFPNMPGGAIPQNIASYSVSVNYHNVLTQQGTVYGWIDWNNNGTFEPSEIATAAASASTAAGVATLTWTNQTLTGPVGTTDTYARIRITTDVLSDDGGSTVDEKALGLAINGEVEDYIIPFQTPLPVTLIDFNATALENNVLLTWSTSEEKGSSYFEIQQSKSGKTWTAIGTVAALRESAVKASYSFKDSSASKGMNLYRLKMVDLDQTIAYSIVRSVEIFGNSRAYLYPNPVSEWITIDDAAKVIEVLIFDVSGRKVLEQKRGPGAIFSKQINVSHLSDGVYTAQLILVSGEKLQIKIIRVSGK